MREAELNRQNYVFYSLLCNRNFAIIGRQTPCKVLELTCIQRISEYKGIMMYINMYIYKLSFSSAIYQRGVFKWSQFTNACMLARISLFRNDTFNSLSVAIVPLHSVKQLS